VTTRAPSRGSTTIPLLNVRRILWPLQALASSGSGRSIRGTAASFARRARRPRARTPTARPAALTSDISAVAAGEVKQPEARRRSTGDRIVGAASMRQHGRLTGRRHLLRTKQNRS